MQHLMGTGMAITSQVTSTKGIYGACYLHELEACLIADTLTYVVYQMTGVHDLVFVTGCLVASWLGCLCFAVCHCCCRAS